MAILDRYFPDARLPGRGAALGYIIDASRVALISAIYHIRTIDIQKKE